MPTQRRVWPPDLWSAALRATQSTSWALCGGRDACEQVRAQHPGWRAWAFDLGQRPGASNHPKRSVAAPVAVFAAAYALLPAEHRHAYEIIDVPCDLYLDLECAGDDLPHGDEMARQVAAAARAVVAELDAERAELRRLAVERQPAAAGVRRHHGGLSRAGDVRRSWTQGSQIAECRFQNPKAPKTKRQACDVDHNEVRSLCKAANEIPRRSEAEFCAGRGDPNFH